MDIDKLAPTFQAEIKKIQNADGTIDSQKCQALFDTTDNAELKVIIKDALFQNDSKKVMDSIVGKITLTDAEKEKLDKDGNGKIDINDAILFLRDSKDLEKEIGIINKKQQAKDDAQTILKSAARIINLSQEKKTRLDKDGDGKISTKDAVLSLQEAEALQKDVNTILKKEQAKDDVQTIKNAFLGKTTLTAAQKQRLDLNGDGFVNMSDAGMKQIEVVALQKDVDTILKKEQTQDDAQKLTDAYKGKIKLSAAEQKRLDKNGDGKINLIDVGMSKQELAQVKQDVDTIHRKEQTQDDIQKATDAYKGKITLTAAEQKRLDKNGDGKVNLIDIGKGKQELAQVEHDVEVIHKKEQLEADVNKLGQFIAQVPGISLTAAEKKKFDKDGDGKISVKDLVLAKRELAQAKQDVEAIHRREHSQDVIKSMGDKNGDGKINVLDGTKFFQQAKAATDPKEKTKLELSGRATMSYATGKIDADTFARVLSGQATSQDIIKLMGDQTGDGKVDILDATQVAVQIGAASDPKEKARLELLAVATGRYDAQLIDADTFARVLSGQATSQDIIKLMGDKTGDGRINSSDALRFLQQEKAATDPKEKAKLELSAKATLAYSVGKIDADTYARILSGQTTSQDIIKIMADQTGDGRINSSDATKFLQQAKAATDPKEKTKLELSAKATLAYSLGRIDSDTYARVLNGQATSQDVIKLMADQTGDGKINVLDGTKFLQQAKTATDPKEKTKLELSGRATMLYSIGKIDADAYARVLSGQATSQDIIKLMADQTGDGKINSSDARRFLQQVYATTDPKEKDKLYLSVTATMMYSSGKIDADTYARVLIGQATPQDIAKLR